MGVNDNIRQRLGNKKTSNQLAYGKLSKIDTQYFVQRAPLEAYNFQNISSELSKRADTTLAYNKHHLKTYNFRNVNNID